MNIDPKINEQAVAVERIHFVKTDRQVNPKKINPFIYLPGKIPVLVSAPHAVRHVRKKQIKSSDEFTGSLAYLLHEITDCHALAVTKLYGGDPNYDDPCIYKDEIERITGEHPVKIVLDIHGAGRERPFDIDLGTMNGRSLAGNPEIITWVRDRFREEGFPQVTNDFFSADKQYTVTRFVAEKLHIPALQLEINRKYRTPHQNGEAYFRLFHALAEVIAMLHEKFSKKR